MSHSIKTMKEAIRLWTLGYGYRRISQRINVPETTVKWWLKGKCQASNELAGTDRLSNGKRQANV